MNITSTDRRPAVTKCLIGGKVYVYDACSDKSESEARAYYADLIYLGYGKIHSVDGIPSITTKWYHFFTK